MQSTLHLPDDVMLCIAEHLAFDGESAAFCKLVHCTRKPSEYSTKAYNLDQPLVFEIEVPCADSMFFLPVANATIVSIRCSWGDGVEDIYIKPPIDEVLQHTYDKPGDYTVRIHRHGPGVEDHKNPSRRIWLDSLSQDPSKDLGCMYDQDWTKYVVNYKTIGDLGIRSLQYLFWAAREEFNPPELACWNVRYITDMEGLFCGADEFNQPLGKWNVSSVTNMDSMFRYSAFNQPIESWDVSSVTTMESMFQDAKRFNQPLGRWNVGRVVNMNRMFESALSFNSPIGTWNVSNVKDMARMFGGAIRFNQSIGSWDVSNVKDMSCMFHRAEAFNSPIGDWNVGNVTEMMLMFHYAVSFNQPIGSWNVRNVCNMNSMFYGARSFNQPISTWILGTVDRRDMFSYAASFSQSLYSWNLSNDELKRMGLSDGQLVLQWLAD